MEKTVGAYEAKTHLPMLLREVGSGYSITITNHGVPVARLVPIQETDEDRRQAAIDMLVAGSHRPPQFSHEELLAARHEGHKY